RIPGGLLKVCHRSSGIASLVEAHGEFGGDCGRSLPIGAFQTTANSLVKTRASLRRDARIHYFLEEIVTEAIARRQRPIRPRRRPVGGENRPARPPGGAARLAFLFRQGWGGDYGGKEK